MQNPKERLLELEKCFSIRRVFATTLAECNDIPYTITQMIDILESIKGMSTETIKEVFKSDPKEWSKKASQSSNKEVSIEEQLTE